MILMGRLRRAIQRDLSEAVDQWGWKARFPLSLSAIEALRILDKEADMFNGHGIKSLATAIQHKSTEGLLLQVHVSWKPTGRCVRPQLGRHSSVCLSTYVQANQASDDDDSFFCIYSLLQAGEETFVF